MYESFFQMNRRPFLAAPQPADYFPAAAIEQARKTLGRCIERAEGTGLLIGPSGTGKTLLCLVLAEQFREKFQVVCLTHGRYATPRALLQAIMYELGRPFRNREEGELRLALIEYATSAERCPGGLLLIVDEAHSMPPRQLEEIRRITNLVRDGQPRVRLMLAGGPELEERLANPRLEALNQRLAARCYLEAFSREETHDYVRAVLKGVASDSQTVFSEDALDAVYAATDGIPRFVNQVCDHALVLAYAEGQQELDKWGVEEAWSDLQQLPTPWNDAEAPAADNGDDDQERGIIEFGRLHDGDPELAADEFTDDPAEFVPAGTIGAQTELVLDASADPFGGEFAEEEVLIDRFASLDAARPPAAAEVASREGSELGEQLEPFMVDDPSPALRVAGKDDEEATGATDVANADETFADVPGQDSIPVAAEDVTGGHDPIEADRDIPAEFDDGDDAGVLVVEDDPEPCAVRLSTGGATRDRYDQLFARLRRG